MRAEGKFIHASPPVVEEISSWIDGKWHQFKLLTRPQDEAFQSIRALGRKRVTNWHRGMFQRYEMQRHC